MTLHEINLKLDQLHHYVHLDRIKVVDKDEIRYDDYLELASGDVDLGRIPFFAVKCTFKLSAVKNTTGFIVIKLEYKYEHFSGGTNGVTLHFKSIDGGKTFETA